MLHVRNLSVSVDGTPILNDLSLNFEPGSTHVIMGPNGSGKSTLANVLAGHPGYTVTGGRAELDGQDLLNLKPEERAHAGVFLAFQRPVAIPGVSVASFLRLALNSIRAARGEKPVPVADFIRELRTVLTHVGLPVSTAERSVHDGLSGGEQKRLELAQMLILKPRVVILDEIDSGLDIDALAMVGQVMNHLKETSPETTVIIITHYQRLLKDISADRVHILQRGRIVETGGPELAVTIERHGYTRTE